MNSLHLKNELRRRGVRFMVGRDRTGRWVVCDRDRLVGGIFSDRASAVHFAMFESDHMPGAVCCVPDEMSLDYSMASSGPRSGIGNIEQS